LGQLSVSAEGAVACSVRHPFGTANLAVRLNDESGFSEVTEGDSVDAAPRWVPGARQLVFQSAGVGRDRNGVFAGLGPFGIQHLDIDSGEMKTLAEDPASDFLTPQMTADGALFYIRRPHATGREIHPGRLLLDFLLFPLRLLYAVFQFFQFFSLRYTGKKLTRSGHAQGREMNLKDIMIWGNRVAARQSEKAGEDAPDLVPKTWQLTRRTPDSRQEIIANGVLAYDLAPDGSVVYSNGNAIFLRDPQGKTEQIHMERLIEQVVVLG
jgi:hypothetical protein